MKKIITLIVALSLSITLISCTESELVINESDYGMKNIVKYLSSENLKGRLTGTEENNLAQEYIKETFEHIDLETYKDNSYLQKYTHKFYDPSKQQISLIIKLNSETKELKYGQDYLPKIQIDNVNINSKISFKTTKEKQKNTVLVIDDIKNISNDIENVQCILVKSNNFKKGLQVMDMGVPVVQISDEIYNLLSSNKNSTIEFKTNFSSEDIIANNVVGKIDNSNDSAIVISAHFDHVGYAGKEIYRGAIDNSSGVATLISVAKSLKEYSLENKLNNDIIVCAFNGEESGLQGSKAFIKELSKDYKQIYSINFDCLGIKDGGNLIITNDEQSNVDDKLVDFTKDFFTNKGYKNNKNTSLTSDHISFVEMNIPAITLIQENLTEIHTREDTLEEIDYNYIEKVSNDAFEYICSLDKDYKSLLPNSVKEENELLSKFNEEKKNLSFDEYKLALIDNKRILITKSRESFSNIDEIKKYYPNINLNKEISNYKLKDISILDSSKPITTEMNIKIGEIYKRTMNKSNIRLMDLLYVSDSGEKKPLAIRVHINKILDKGISKESSSDNPNKKIDIKGREYIISYNSDSNRINDIKTIVNYQGKSCTIYINKVKILAPEYERPVLFVDNIEEVINLINEINIDELVDIVS